MISSHGRWWGACLPRLGWAFRVPIGNWRLPNWVLGSAHGLRASAWALGASRSPWDRVLGPAVGISVRSWPCLWVDYSEAPLRRSGCMWLHMPSSVSRPGVLYGPRRRRSGLRFARTKIQVNKSQLPIALMTFAVKHYSMARGTARVSCIA